MDGFSGLGNTSRAELILQFLCFAGIGAVGTMAQYVVLIGLIHGTALSPVVASGAGFVVGGLVNYVLNYHITFRSAMNHSEALTKFLAVALIGLLLNTLIMEIGTKVFSLHYLLAQVMATGLVLTWNFAGNRLWTFREGINAANR